MSQWIHPSFAIDSQFSPSSKDNLEHFLVHLRADKPGREQSPRRNGEWSQPWEDSLSNEPQQASVWAPKEVPCFPPTWARETAILARQEGKNMQMLPQASVVHEGWFQWGRWLLWKSAMPKELPGVLLLQTAPKDVNNKCPALQRPVISTHQSDPNQALHKPRKPTWDTFR